MLEVRRQYAKGALVLRLRTRVDGKTGAKSCSCAQRFHQVQWGSVVKHVPSPQLSQRRYNKSRKSFHGTL